MRFLVVTITEGYGSAAPDDAPGTKAAAEMQAYSASLHRAGVLLALDRLCPPSAGARICFADGKATVTEGPLPESSDFIGAYWILQVRSREEAIEWAKRAPVSNTARIEVRQIRETPHLPEDVRKAAESFEQRTR